MQRPFFVPLIIRAGPFVEKFHQLRVGGETDARAERDRFRFDFRLEAAVGDRIGDEQFAANIGRLANQDLAKVGRRIVRLADLHQAAIGEIT